MKKTLFVFLLIVAVPVTSQTVNKWYLFGGLGSYSTTAVDSHTIWHLGAGFQLNQRFGFELDYWPGISGESAYVDDVDVYYFSCSTTIRTGQIVRSPDVHFVFKGGVSQWRSTDHEDVGIPKIKRGALVVGAGIIVNPEDKLSFEFSASQVLDKFENSGTFKATLRLKF